MKDSHVVIHLNSYMAVNFFGLSSLDNLSK